jgi:serine/threonine-protein kinase
VEVVVSAGTAPRIVPDLTGLDAPAAEAALAQNGLVGSVAPEQQFSELPAGQVTSQDPAAGTELAKGGTVTYVISKGPDVVALPPLLGASLADATSALVAAGFQVGAAQGNVQGAVVEVSVGGAVVADQALVPRGSTVDLTLF